jgi:hypothetical protein
MDRTIGYIKVDEWEPPKETIVEHKAESQWQYCMCRTCQKKRHMMEALPGPPINWDTVRLKDEHY